MSHGIVKIRDVEHIEVGMNDKKQMFLKLPETQRVLPKVCIITQIQNDLDALLLTINLVSWNTLQYPKDLLSWVVHDPKELVNISDAPFISHKKKYPTLDKFMDYIFENHTKCVYMFMCPGDLMVPDTLTLKHRALQDKLAVFSDTHAIYNFIENTSTVYKHALKFLRNGLYFKKEWWNTQSSKKAIAVPYIANCVTIGTVPDLHYFLKNESSIKFNHEFSKEVNTIIMKIQEIHIKKLLEEKESDL